MRLVKVEHSRCDEYDGTEYFMAPNGWSEEAVAIQINQVMKELIAHAKVLKDGVPEVPNPPWHPEFTKYPDKTVQEVLDAHEEAKAAYNKWYAENKKLCASFEARMREVGFTGLWELEEGDDVQGFQEYHAYWGHNHGLDLNYKHLELPEW